MSKIKTLMVLAAMAAWGSSQALTIDARLTHFEPSGATGGSGYVGAIANFELLTDVTGTAIDQLGVQFMAQCLEPQEGASAGTAYSFDVVPLADAPTYRAGGMGGQGADWIENIMGGMGFTSVEGVAAADLVTRSAIGLSTVESAHEMTADFDFASGSFQLWGVGVALTDEINAARLGDVALTGFGLLNRGPVGSSSADFAGQDFAVYFGGEVNPTVSVASPGVPALMGLGMLGMVGAARRAARK